MKRNLADILNFPTNRLTAKFQFFDTYMTPSIQMAKQRLETAFAVFMRSHSDEHFQS